MSKANNYRELGEELIKQLGYARDLLLKTRKYLPDLLSMDLDNRLKEIEYIDKQATEIYSKYARKK